MSIEFMMRGLVVRIYTHQGVCAMKYLARNLAAALKPYSLSMRTALEIVTAQIVICMEQQAALRDRVFARAIRVSKVRHAMWTFGAILRIVASVVSPRVLRGHVHVIAMMDLLARLAMSTSALVILLYAITAVLHLGKPAHAHASAMPIGRALSARLITGHATRLTATTAARQQVHAWPVLVLAISAGAGLHAKLMSDVVREIAATGASLREPRDLAIANAMTVLLVIIARKTTEHVMQIFAITTGMQQEESDRVFVIARTGSKVFNAR